MAKTFKVGDKVRAIDNHYGVTTLDYGFEGVIKHVSQNGALSIKQTKPMDRNIGLAWGGLSSEHFELVDVTPTKKQRIKALESEVEALKARVKALESGVIKNDEAGRDYIADKFRKALEKAIKQQTPNQRRKAVIERAKAFVEDTKNFTGAVSGRKGYKYDATGKICCDVKFVENKEKRTVMALLTSQFGKDVRAKGVAKCTPDDVFNVHIGRAIALAKAIGLECPREFMYAPQPEPAVGQVVKATSRYVETPFKINYIDGIHIHEAECAWITKDVTQILDDSEAQYDEA